MTINDFIWKFMYEAYPYEYMISIVEETSENVIYDASVYDDSDAAYDEYMNILDTYSNTKIKGIGIQSEATNYAAGIFIIYV